MDGDTGKLHDLCNVKYKVENERGYSGTRFNRKKSEYREKKKIKFSRQTEKNVNNSTTKDLAYVKTDKKSSTESKQYKKSARQEEFAGKPSVDLKPLKSILSSFSIIAKDEIKELISSDSQNVAVVNEHRSRDLNVKHRVTNEVKVLYERDINEGENDQNISQRKSGNQNRRNKNSQLHLFGFQHCMQRKRHLNVFYNFLQCDAKRDKCLCSKHYSIEDVNPEKPKKKSSFVKSHSDNPAAPNLLKVTERTTVSNIYLLKPKDAKKSESFKKSEIPGSRLDLDTRKSILKKGDGVDNVNAQTLKTKSKEKNIATTDHLKRRSFSGGSTAVNDFEPTKMRNKRKAEPIVCDSCKQSKYTGVFAFLCAATKYLLFITIVIIWSPCILFLGFLWLITYPFRPHQDAKRKRKIKTSNKPRQNTTKNVKDANCAYSKNKSKYKRYALFRKNRATSCKTNRKKMTGKNRQSKSLKSTLVNNSYIDANIPREGSTSSQVGKKKHKSVTFKQSSKNRGSETITNVSKSKDITCSGCWKIKSNIPKSVDDSLDKNKAKQDKKQKTELDKKCQQFLIKSCQGNMNQDRKVEICAPKPLLKVLQTVLCAVCSKNNEFGNLSKLSKNKSSNTIHNKSFKYTVKGKFSKRWCSTTTPNKHMALSSTSGIDCVPLPCPGGCSIIQATKSQAAKGDKNEKSRINLREGSTSKSALAPVSTCCDRTTCCKKPCKHVSVHKLFPPVRPSVRTESSNTIKTITPSVCKSKEKKQDNEGQKEKNLSKLQKQKGKKERKGGIEICKAVKKCENEDKQGIKKRDKEDKTAKKREKKDKKHIKKHEKENGVNVRKCGKEEDKSVKTFEKEENKIIKKSDKEKEKNVNKLEKDNEKKCEKEEKKSNNPCNKKGNPCKKNEKEEKKANNPCNKKGNPGKKREKVEKKASTPCKKHKNTKKCDKPYYVKKYYPAPSSMGTSYISSNTRAEMSTLCPATKSQKCKTHERSVTSVNTSKDISPSKGKVKSKSSSACLTTATKIIKYLPKPRSYSVGSITTEVKLPLKPLEKQKPKIPPGKDKSICKPPGLVLQDRKSFARRRSQEMIANKPRTIYKFFPSPIPSTRSISVGARLQDKVKIPSKSSQSTSIPRRRLFGSLTATMATNTCSVGPTRIFKYIKSKKSLITRGTVPVKFKEEKAPESGSGLESKQKKIEKPSSKVTFFVPGRGVDTSRKKDKKSTKPKLEKKEERPRRVTFFVKGKSVDKYSKKDKKPAKPGLKKGPCTATFFISGKNVCKRSVASTTTRVCTKSRKVTSKSAAPIIRFLLPTKSSTRTRGVNPRKEKFCFMKELRDFSKKQVCKYRKTSEIIPKRIVICKRPDGQAGDIKSSRSPSSTEFDPSKNKLVCKRKSLLSSKEKDMEKKKDRAMAMILKAQKTQAKELAKQRAEERAQVIALQKAEICLQDLKAQQEIDKLQKKNREKLRKRKLKPKLTFKQHAILMLKQLNPATYAMECQDLIARGPKPCKIIYDLWPSAYPGFMVLYKIYNNVMRIFFFFLACCAWSPLFCWCFLFYVFIIKRLLC